MEDICTLDTYVEWIHERDRINYSAFSPLGWPMTMTSLNQLHADHFEDHLESSVMQL